MAQTRVQRRLAAILAVDVVGYSRMMGEDEAGTLARLKMLRKEIVHPKVDEYGGRIVKEMGDGILIEFPSAVDAVQHAIDVQQAMGQRNKSELEGQRIILRMGINLGDVIVDGDDIYGDGVNIAARLEALAEPGKICVSAMVREGVRGKLDVPFNDLGEQSLKNIAEPVRVYGITPVIERSGDASEKLSNALFRRPAIAVLPFQNMSGDPEQEYFADGLTEDIITALSLWRSFPVIARNSTFSYKGKSPDIRQVGIELGARYVIEGSVRKAAGRVRVTAQLINAETGYHIWAERYDRDLADIFNLQEELSQRIAATVAPEMSYAQAPMTRTSTPQNLDAWELVQRGYGLVFNLDLASIMKAREYFEQAIELDPSYSRAFTGLAWSYHRELWLDPSKFAGEIKTRFIEVANRAVSLDELDSDAHAILSMACNWYRDNDRALFEARRAVELNPNNAHAHQLVGQALTLLGNPLEGIRDQEMAMLLSPRDPRQGVWMWTLGLTYLTARNYDQAILWCERAIQRHPKNPEAPVVLASSLGHLGRREEAHALRERYAEVVPNRSNQPTLIWPYKHDADNEHFRDGLRKAGWNG